MDDPLLSRAERLIAENHALRAQHCVLVENSHRAAEQMRSRLLGVDTERARLLETLGSCRERLH